LLTHQLPAALKEIHVDLDGTLHPGDIVKETALFLLLRAPHRMFVCIIRALFQGLPLKQCLADEVGRPVVALNLNESLVDWLGNVRRFANGRVRVFINTGAPMCLIDRDAIDRRLSPDGYITAADKRRNVGVQKLEGVDVRAICYIGNSHEDLPIFDRVDHLGVVGPMHKTVLANGHENKLLFADPGVAHYPVQELIKLIRVKHWLKNTLVFTVLLFQHDVTLQSVGKLAGAFLVFCLLSSIVYVINDLYDINADRAHQTKRNRPIAAGRISIVGVMLLLAVMVIAELTLAVVVSELGGSAIGVLAVYLGANILYSTYLKHVRFLNIFIMPVFYILRVVFGLVCVEIAPSPVLLAFFFFGMIPMAVLKRTREIQRANRASPGGIIRGYKSEDVNQLNCLAYAAIATATSITALFWINLLPSPSVLQSYLMVLSTVLVFVALWVLVFGEGGDDDDTFGMVSANKPFLACGALFIVIYSILVAPFK
jgi:4-hydroxybenzoate polyprenyltransferase